MGRKYKLSGKTKNMSYDIFDEYLSCIEDLLSNANVIEMNDYVQHRDVSTLEHCLCVSYYSFLVCKKLRLNYKAAARGGLLHDFFLYDWHKPQIITDRNGKTYKGMHGFVHPDVALANAEKIFCGTLENCECDIIKNHMWPLTLRVPRFKETLAVVAVDKYIAFAEVIGGRCLLKKAILRSGESTRSFVLTDFIHRI